MYDIHIMLVEDEERLRKLVAKYLIKEGYKVYEAEDGKKAIEIFEINHIDLIILDVMMPEIDGWTVCRKIRKQSDVPIIMLTARDAEDDKVFGFELGVDQYVTKPFSSKELVARVKALLKKNLKSDDQINLGDLVIELKSHDVTKAGVSIELSPKEFDLLIYFVHNQNAALTRDMILDRVWGYDYYGDARTVDTHIKRLRKKIIESSVVISTVRGVGYKLEVK